MKVLLLLVAILCSGYKTEKITEGVFYSKPVPLYFIKNNPNDFYLTLSNDLTKGEYFVHVRWSSSYQEQQFDYERATLKFLVNKDFILTLTPYTFPKVVSCNIDPNSVEEECVFKISFDQLKKITYAQDVKVEFTRRNEVSIASFSKLNTARVFKDFLKFY